MKGQLIFRIFVDISSYPCEFFCFVINKMAQTEIWIKYEKLCAVCAVKKSITL